MKKILLFTISLIIINITKAQTTDVGVTEGQLNVNLTGAATYTIPISVPPGIKDVVPKIALSYSSQAGNGMCGWGWNISGVSSISRIPATVYHDGEIDGVDFDNKDRYALDGQRLILSTGTYGVDGSTYVTENYSNIKIKAFGIHPNGASYGPNYFEVYYPNGNIVKYGGSNNATSMLNWSISQFKDIQYNTINYFYSMNTEPRLISQIKYGSGNGSNSGINSIIFNWVSRNRIESNYVGGNNVLISEKLNYIQVNGYGNVIFRKYLLTYDNIQNYDRLISVKEQNDIGNFMPAINFEYNSNQTSINPSVISSGININEDYFNHIGMISGDFNTNGNIDLVLYKRNSNILKIYTGQQFNSSINVNNFPLIREDSKLFTAKFIKNNKLDLKDNIAFLSQYNKKLNIFYYTLVNNVLTLSHSQQVDTPLFDDEQCLNISGSQQLVVNKKEIPFDFYDGDFNGDGVTDFLCLEKDHNVNNCTDNSTFNNGLREIDPVDNCSCVTEEDINNNSTYFYNPINNSLTNLGSNFGGNNDYLFNIGEFNGDGKTDFYVFSLGKIDIYTLNQNNLLELVFSLSNSDIHREITNLNSIDKYFPIITGDFNGDGLTDFMCPNTTPNPQNLTFNKWRIFISTGKNFIEKSYIDVNNGFIYNKFISQPDYYRRVQFIATDLNADGKSDFIKHITEWENPSANIDYFESVNVYFNEKILLGSINNNYFQLNQIYSYQNEDSSVSAEGFPVFIDSNHANFAGEYAYIAQEHVWGGGGENNNINIKSYFSLGNILPNFQLKKVTNNSIQTQIEYQNLTPQNTNYQTDNSEFYPNVNINFSPFTYVVNRITESAGNISRSQYYKYQGFVSNLNGLGFLGTKLFRQSSWFDNNAPATNPTPVIWSASYFDHSKRGANTQSWTSFSNNSIFNSSGNISKTETTYNYTLQPNKVYTVLPTQVVSTDVIQSIITTSTTQYDTYNNPINTLTSFSGGSKKVELEYYNNPTPFNNTYYIGKPKKKKETNELGSETLSTEEQYTYLNSNNSNLISVVKKKGTDSTNWVTETFNTYDTFGNIMKKTLSANGVAGRVEEFTYDTTGRFLKTKKDIEGLVTTYNSDAVTGNILSETSPYGLVTSYQYDHWGRLWKTTDYLGNISTLTLSNYENSSFKKSVDYPQGQDEETIINAFGWETSKRALTLNNKWVEVSQQYDILGRKTQVSEPYFTTESPTQWTSTVYDQYGRISSITEPTGKVTTSQYSALTTTVSDGVKTITTYKDAVGNIITMTDPGGTVNYTYYSNGTMKTANYGGHVVSTQIDGWGRKISLNDPDAGTYTYNYNDLGELLSETTPKGTTNYTYDNFGKLIAKQIIGDYTNITTTYSYNATSKLLTTVQGTSNTDGNNQTQTINYDGYKRISSISEISATDNTNFSKTLTYDSMGRLETTQYATTFSGQNSTVKTKNIYDANGILYKITDFNTNQELWYKVNENARGQVIQINLGNGSQKNRSYDNYGYMQSINDIKTSYIIPEPIDPNLIDPNPPHPQLIINKILSINYNFNPQRGLLNSRNRLDINHLENFGYDTQERLTTISGSVNFTQNYDVKGRIADNSTIGSYNYINANDYRVKDINLNNAGQTYYQSHTLQQVTYNAFKKPVEIIEQGHGKVSFEYNPITLDRSRAYYGNQEVNKQNRTFHKYYSSIIPVEITKNITTGEIKIVTFVGGDAYSAPIVHIKRTGSSVPLNTFYYIHRDYLGSILAISDSQGNVVERRQFGAWGVVDYFSNATGSTTFNDFSSLLNRGYTGHEHFFGVSLIHMNGRMYDPKLGRFLSPDNFVQDPYNTQNFNRYSYVLNNPLMFTDKSGEFIWFAVAIGALINMTSAAIQGKSFGQVMLAGAIGAAAGIVGGGFANLAAGGAFLSNAAANVVGFSSGFAAGAAGGFVGGFVGGAGMAWANGASFADGFGEGLKTGFIGSITGGFMGGITGGIRANKMGLDFWNGDIVRDANKFNGLFKSDYGAVACNDCSSGGGQLIGQEGMFQNGESIRNFRADLSGPDDFGQAFKAFKKASILKGTKFKDLFQTENMDNWLKNGWKASGIGGAYNSVTKDFFGSYRLVVGSSFLNNFRSTGIIQASIDVGNDLGSSIFISGGNNAGPLAQWSFIQSGPGITDLNDSWFSLMQSKW